MDWEEQTQIALYTMFQRQYPNYTHRWHHSPNGGKRSRSTGAKLKAMGTQKGFPDVCIFLPTRYRTFFAMELKTAGNESAKALRGKPTPEQIDWLDKLQWCLAEVHIAYGYDEAKALVVDYMNRAIEYHDWCKQQVEILREDGI